MPSHDFGPRFGEGIERGFDGGFHWFGILPLLLFAVLIGVIVWAVIRLTRDGGVRIGGSAAPAMLPAVAPARPDAAMEELRLRYARGEMTRADYADRLHDLAGGASEAPAREPSAPEASQQAPPDGT